VARLRPQVVLVDRPSLPGQLAPGAAVRELADAACEVGAVVVVDEAYATYLGPPASCAPLVARLHNLVVLRSLSKGYGWGGLRAGYCVSSAALTERLRELVTPLATSSLSLAAALALLGAGDAFAALRARVREVKPLVSARLAELGIAHAHGHEELPWLLLDDRGVGARARLAALGVGVRPVLDGATGRAADHAKLCLPISAERLARFDELTRP
jgi:histidinol-phosphate/aromatic aminotransferase/cobyric acid decarboxylase-like protein